MLTAKYSLFAAISTLVSLLFQYLSFQVYSSVGSLYLAMFFGTLAGLVTKYILDKKYIFYHTPEDKTDDAMKFALYSFMGVFTTNTPVDKTDDAMKFALYSFMGVFTTFTTIIFWGTEITFDALFESPYAKYTGAVIGLMVGYIIKYFLDKKYVFIHKQEVVL